MGRGVIWGAWALAAISSACLPSAATTCDDGSLCPAGTVCLSTGGCALAAQVEACADAVDGAACSFPGAPDGVCASGVCSVPRCGNGLLEFGEVCDDGNAAFGDGCSPRCDSDEACGNGVIDALIGEQCDCGDDAAALPPGCAQPNGDAPGSICRAGCVAVGCGDGVVAAPEDCEGADLAGGACTDLGFYSGELACLPSCRYDTSACVGLCGDGVLDDAEACDTVSEESCADYGLAFGRPTCNGACGVDTRDCGRADWVRVFAAGGMTIGRGVRDEADRYYFSDANDRVLIYTPGEGVTERAAPFSPSYIDGSSSTDLWIAGNQVARWDGASWTTTWSPGAFEYVADLALAGPGLPVIAGNFYGSGTGDVGFVERWDGVAWTRLVDDIPTWMTSIAACPDGRVVAGGFGGLLTIWDDGVVVSEHPLDTTADIAALYCRPDDELLIALASGDVVVRRGGRDDALPLGGGFSDIVPLDATTTAILGSAVGLYDGRTLSILPRGARGAWRDAAGHTFISDDAGLHRGDHFVSTWWWYDSFGQARGAPTAMWRAAGGRVLRDEVPVADNCDYATGISLLDDGDAVVGCADGLRTCDELGCMPIGGPLPAPVFGVLPGDELVAVATEYVNDAWVTTGARWADGIWTPVDTSALPTGLTGIDVTPAGTAWGVSLDGIARLAGAGWTLVPGSPTSCYSVRALADDEVFAACGSGLVHRWDGAAWHEESLGTVATITSLAGDRADALWASDYIGNDSSALWHRDALGWYEVDTSEFADQVRRLSLDSSGDLLLGGSGRLHLRRPRP